MQRHSVVVQQLFHYKGQPNPLKGDALNLTKHHFSVVDDQLGSNYGASSSEVEERLPLLEEDNLNGGGNGTP